MDVLQKEIDEVYATQLIADEILDNGVVEQHQRFIHSLTEINGGCAVISDLSNRKSYIAVHPWAHFLGLTPEEAALSVIDSMDEDCIYRRIHPEDLVEKRLLEYQFFQKTFSMSSEERLKYRGRCRIRMMNEKGVYQYIDNLVQIMENTPSGSVWLIFCLYTLSADQRTEQGICPTVSFTPGDSSIGIFSNDLPNSIICWMSVPEIFCPLTCKAVSTIEMVKALAPYPRYFRLFISV